MNFFLTIKTEIQKIWQVKSNRTIIKDTLLFFVATITFHILYWNANMNTWIFGPYTKEVFDFFTNLVYKASTPFISLFTNRSFDIADTSYYFYTLSEEGVKQYYAIMTVIDDCSGVKQLLQWALVMILCRGKWFGKIFYYLFGAIILLFANILRVLILTGIFSVNASLFHPIHDWVARPAMYVIIFVMWLFWLSLIDKKKAKKEEKLQEKIKYQEKR
ncbi:MAG: exosortase/archaeosortase family protein [Bacteroidota bacterium]|nr:exosortase/archaeosortase family protein [Bacteroidota bacterium]